jgi:hypothetical protein
MTINGDMPRAPMRRAVTKARPNTASVVSQRQTKGPAHPPICHTGQITSRNPQEGVMAGSP